ncbi:acetyl/propionyl/methylcrotonyl-CoA carboxylase subunit alpha [Agrobacterium tumefaciens]|jgi:3-methylcrotonyl-CoA carboxylase alpha subunit|uniref:acetyl/propionyl/methylcrotonyl-CoA carboxylase subunit alpha n=1 Tax=Agrobacterium tumefaciens TaxID=358 RepID=UPI0009BA60DC|nr:acetyl/propionyl/methylcrotonyl-CoA carboxylase subunit alpha [Agrobacterium tumefaciens]NTD86281.1 acetyl/propionyl/methylcrotonyl-CoA carboxylase subunit alpha [Agrobacterium tumefaciens]NTD90044.1 acetyl/propionyl/methylcrotonyl-CoA carboxylase subunit alpha [Agrobacterium tumefaciens]NTD97974.1 acetyl/propionyl/methylcrotonyl-CoA carboxylase subunit alpha [Agrobacterium tumefaciens]NTE12887.1 acetyl/propionyl/methylcrotonyl-CoA carboxylase subunit alpha [Agrobacterium tumefaciens]NTE256
MFSKILIANRGEIACRIIRTARKMGIRTVAVYSDADRDAMHVALADEAIAIGPAPARSSYLDAEKIIAAAQASGAQAIHPGYGFLSENAGFAEACASAGIIFIGPTPDAIRAMGGKSEAKALMAQAGVPVVPGYHGEDQADEKLAGEAEAIGYPVLLKASAGGGGKGMRIVREKREFAAELAGAKREALAAFGNDRMLIEKYLERPRHVEVQVFADGHGNCLSLFERDCSIQRRHQKVIEEAPAPGLPDTLRQRMYDAAVAAARAIDYRGAGTVEFLLDPSGEFYFMEMNTRLQVEHPVTEYITGLDLVEWQIRVANGEALPDNWGNLRINGHAIEARIYAEDPTHDFLPSIGTVSHLAFPEEGPHLRIDSGIRTGDAISVHYDPMIAKLIVWDYDRPSAVRRLRLALEKLAICGVTSNAAFLTRLAGLDAFAAAELHTGFIARNEAALFTPGATSENEIALSTLGLLLSRRNGAKPQADPYSPWNNTNSFRLNAPARETLRFVLDQQPVDVAVTHEPDGFSLEIGTRAIRAHGSISQDGTLRATVDGRQRQCRFFASDNGHALFLDGEHYRISQPDPVDVADTSTHTGGLEAPMPGVIRAILSKQGAAVEAGDALVVMEAMKMEHTIRAPAKGTVTAINCAEGNMIEAGAMLVDFEPEGA